MKKGTQGKGMQFNGTQERGAQGKAENQMNTICEPKVIDKTQKSVG